ncbi:MAG: sigma-70 family RNA polymerase sigma factor, partial [Planctomycetes bacterium]|nr:sigma-70 family RNA polymerase sigma factor [Planctomycetota bacterium]
TITNTILLDGLKDPGNESVWRQFVERYRPTIVAAARRFGLNEADAQDAAQQAVVAFCTAYQEGKYDREKGRLRHWLFGIARNQMRNLYKKSARRKEMQIANDSGETDFFARLNDGNEFEQIWEEEWRDSVLRQCLEEVSKEFDAKSIEAFKLFAWKGQPAQDVADGLGMTSNAVFIAKHRIMKRIRELMPKMEDIW